MKMKIKRVAINAEMLINMFEGGTAWRVTSGIPKNARFCGVTIDPFNQTIHLFLEHDSFDLVDVSKNVAPQLDIFFKKI